MRLVYMLHMCRYTQSVKACEGTTCVADISQDVCVLYMLCCVLSVALSITRYTCKSIVFKYCTSIPSTEYTHVHMLSKCLSLVLKIPQH